MICQVPRLQLIVQDHQPSTRATKGLMIPLACELGGQHLAEAGMV